MTVLPFIERLPKAELHLHIEGTFEPELMFRIARRNNAPLPFASPAEGKAAYSFSNLDEFLSIYYRCMSVLLTQDEFYDLTRAYLDRVSAQTVAT